MNSTGMCQLISIHLFLPRLRSVMPWVSLRNSLWLRQNSDQSVQLSAIYVLGGASNFLCLLTYAGGPKSSLIWGCIAGVAAFVVSLIVGLVVGFGTPGEGEGLKNYKGKPKKA